MRTTAEDRAAARLGCARRDYKTALDTLIATISAGNKPAQILQGRSEMNPHQIGSTQLGSDRRFQGEVAAQACEVTPEFIVRYRPRSGDGKDIVAVPTAPGATLFFHQERFTQTRAEAEEFALSLVHAGESEPNSICIYENTGARVAVSVQTSPRPATR